jgi:hypothetical protein
MSVPDIRYLKRDEVDIKKWDQCIISSANGLLYASSVYLDSLSSGQWDALVSGNYEVVMPLPFRKKYGIYYLYQPALLPVLGVFGNNLPPDLIHAFLDLIPPRYKLWDISLNHFNRFDRAVYKTFSRSNYILSLEQPYEEIRERYHNNIKRNLTKAIKANCMVRTGISIDLVIEICKQTFSLFTKTEKGLFERLKKVFHQFIHNSVIYGVYRPDGRLLASAAFIFFKERAYYWLVGNDPDGREYGASSLLLDAFIRDHASKKILLDFEGSDAQSVATFYSRFGATLEPYTTIYNNKLPFPIRSLKPLPALYRSLLS